MWDSGVRRVARVLRAAGSAVGMVGMVAALASLGAPTAARAQDDVPRERRDWIPRLRLMPTLTTEARGHRSGGGFGLQLGAEWGRRDGRVSFPLALELAGDDRRQLNCLACQSGRMSAWLLTTGVIVRPVTLWRVRPWVEGTVSGGLVQWSNAVLPTGLVGVGIVGGGQVGGGFASRTSVGAGLDVLYDDRWITVGLQQGLVREARWQGVRAVHTIVIGLRSTF